MANIVSLGLVIILLYIPVDTVEAARSIARSCVGSGLAVCANVPSEPMLSIYQWEDKICEENESLLLLKALPDKVQELKEKVKELHPYSTPCILEISAQANQEYLDWAIRQE